MLFSHPDVVRSLNERFECAWEMLRPVPKVTIDFGDGSVLERTLHGNIATCITLADGRVIDAIPGLVDPVEYQRRLDAALRLHGQVVFTLTAADDARATELVQAYHGDPATWADVDPAEKLAVLTEERHREFLSKMRVEVPLKSMLRDLHIERLSDDRVYTPADDPDAPADFLVHDTEYNRRVRNPQVRAMLAARPLSTPAALTEELYRDVLDVDLADPYLGLAPYVLGGEDGRH